MKADHVVRVREDFQYSIAIGLRLICTFQQGTEVYIRVFEVSQMPTKPDTIQQKVQLRQ